MQAPEPEMQMARSPSSYGSTLPDQERGTAVVTGFLAGVAVSAVVVAVATIALWRLA